MMDRQPTHHCIKCRVWQWIIERVTTKVRHALTKPTTPRKIGCNRVQLGLQFKRADIAANNVRQETCRAADSGPDIKYSAPGPQAEFESCASHCFSSVIVPLIQRKELLWSDLIIRANTETSQSLLNSIQMRIHRHRLD